MPKPKVTPPVDTSTEAEVKPALSEEEIEAAAVDRTETQRIDADGQPLEPPPGHGGRAVE